MALGTAECPLRVAVIGAGPAGFYAAELLLRSRAAVTVDMFEALPSPYGLVRYGVAPDHPKMRTVIDRFDRTSAESGCAYFGNVQFGRDIDLETLRRFYDALIFTTGSPETKLLGIPGEELPGSFSAREMINWYNCYPDTPDPHIDLSCDTAVVIGNGNVALDIARMLCHTPAELAATDVGALAQQALAASRVRTVYVIGRRGLVQASFTHPEISELEKLSECAVIADPEILALDPADAGELEDADHMQVRRFLPAFERFAANGADAKPRTLRFRFLRSPERIEGNGRVERIILRKNRLEGDPGARRAVPTEAIETIDCGLVFSCVGYRGVQLPGLPFDARRGVVPNVEGRVVAGDRPVPGLYVSGWIKRGPSGVIGTNKVDSKETVEALLADLETLPACPARDSGALRQWLLDRNVRPVDFGDWQRITAREAERGARAGKPLERFTSIAEMLDVLEG